MTERRVGFRGVAVACKDVLISKYLEQIEERTSYEELSPSNSPSASALTSCSSSSTSSHFIGSSSSSSGLGGGHIGLLRLLHDQCHAQKKQHRPYCNSEVHARMHGSHPTTATVHEKSLIKVSREVVNGRMNTYLGGLLGHHEARLDQDLPLSSRAVREIPDNRP